jgi:6-hydroxytryprostatin B O-methyltransferase
VNRELTTAVEQVGGSSGHASIALAQAFPKLQFVVQDLPKVIETSQANTKDLDGAISSRITFQAHNFFEPQPVTDADVYLLRMILHDWPPTEARTIMTQIFNAFKPGARIVVMDTALPVPGSVSVAQEAQLRVRDLTMLETFNAHEREMEEWESLFQSVDKRLKIVKMSQPAGSNMAVMELAVE